MDKDREKPVEDQLKDLDNLEVSELDDESLEDASGGLPATGNNLNCGCGPS